MITFLVTTLIIMLALGLVSYVSSKRSNVRTRSDVRSVAPAGRHQVRESRRRVHLLLPDHDIDRGQHHPNSGSLFVAVIARNEQTVAALSEEYERWRICTRFLRMLRTAKP